MPDAEKLAAVRDGLPATGAGIYLNTPVCGPLPAESARAMADIADWELATGRGNRERADDVAVRVDEARAGLAAVLGAEVDDVGLTHGLADAFRRAVWAVDWRPGDRLLAIDTPGSVLAAAIRPPVNGVVIDVLDLPDDADSSDDLGLISAVSAATRPRTRLVALPHVTAWGRVLPVKRLVALARDGGAIALVDGSHAAGAIPVSIADIGADVYVVPGWSWLLGPQGIGGMVVRGDARERLNSSVDAGDFHLPSVVGFARSLGWLSMYVGLEWIHGRSAAMADSTRAGLAAVPGVDVLGGKRNSSPTISFRIRGWTATAGLEELGARVFALASVVPDADAIRVGAGFFNTEDELDRFVSAVELLATHTPDTLPPRRQLTIIGGDW
jgi:L-cysteine/cystine lyase